MLLREVGWVQQDDLRVGGERNLRLFAEDAEGSLQPAPVVGPSLPANERREIALRMAREQGAVTRRQLAVRCGVSGETGRADLSMLVRLGLLRPVGKGSATKYVPA